jgi:hypothetical protein
MSETSATSAENKPLPATGLPADEVLETMAASPDRTPSPPARRSSR